MKQQRPRRPAPATVISLLALFVALGGTAFAAVGSAGGQPDSSPDRHVNFSAKPSRAAVGSPPIGRATKALGSRKLSFVSGSAIVGGNPQNANYNSATARATCPPGKVALSVSTQWPAGQENFELATSYARITADAKGRPKGGEARGASDLPQNMTFTVYVLCAG